MVLAQAASLIDESAFEQAEKLVREQYPFKPRKKGKKKPGGRKENSVIVLVNSPESRKYSQPESLRIFSEDGYIDRYSGNKLVCPSALYALSVALPSVFPWFGKRAHSHQGLWDLFPTIDHVIPVSCGGEDVRANWVTTSMTLNMFKSNKSMDSLGWSVCSMETSSDWDGLTSWYANYSETNTEVAKVRNNIGWHEAMIRMKRENCAAGNIGNQAET